MAFFRSNKNTQMRLRQADNYKLLWGPTGPYPICFMFVPGGGGTFICMHIGYVPRERPPCSALNFRSGAYHFHKLQKNPFRSMTILHFWADFAVPGTIIFFLIYVTRSSPSTASSARTQSVRQRRGLAAGQSASQTRLGSSGDSHFHAQNGSSSFRNPAFSRSTGSSFRSP